MAKVLTGKELAEIALKATDPESAGFVDDIDQYENFVKGLADLVTTHFGGRVGLVQWVDELEDITVAISDDGCIPEDGGVYAKYDPEGELR